MTDLAITHIGGPTTLIELDGVRLLVDPTFDAPGRRYRFGWGTSSRKTGGPALTQADLGRLDGVLLSHDQHADNLDDAGRALLPSVPVVLTTVSGARRLGGNAVGLAAFQSHTVGDIEVTATPARHGPPLSRPIVGETTGFALRTPGSTSVLWISGDTVLFDGLLSLADHFTVDTAILHLGKVRFRLTGPLKYTMSSQDAAKLTARLKPRRIVPVHYEGWSHFHEDPPSIKAAFPPNALTWLTPGTRTPID